MKSPTEKNTPQDEAHFRKVRRKAHKAICLELRDFDWMSLDHKTAMKIHGLLPPDKPPYTIH